MTTQPTRADLIARVRADYRNELGIDPISRSWETAASFAQAGLAKGLYGYQDWALRQLAPDTADDIFFWRHLNILGLTAKPAAPWRGTLAVTGTTGTNIPALSTLARIDGQIYVVDTTSVVGSVVDVTAATPGKLGNNTVGQTLQFSSPIAGVGPTATVLAETQTGTDPETRDQALPRVLDRLSDPPRGGSLADYKRWALEVPGVTRAGAKLVGVNRIYVWALRDGDGAPDEDIIPSAEECVTIEKHIDLVRPAQVFVDVVLLTPQPLDIVIKDLVPDLPSVRAAIAESLFDFLRREAHPDNTLFLSRLDAAISEAEGEESHTLMSPATNLVSTNAQQPVINSITFTFTTP